MAAYIHHAQMAYDTYNEMKKDNLLKIEIDSKLMTTFSAGIDLSGYNELTHNKRTQAFLLNLFKEVKELGKTKDPKVMAILYGHVCHYFLDTSIHPYIYYIERGTKPVLLQCISAHTMIEGYLSAYIIKKRLNASIMDIPIEKYFTNFPKEGQELLNRVYYQTYQLNGVAKNYQNTLNILLFCENILKNTPLKSKELCEKIIRFQKYLEKNNLELEEIENERESIWFHPVTGEENRTSVIDMYFHSIEHTLEAVRELNKYLYGSNSLESLKEYFPNISYDTGTNLEEKSKMMYYRRKV